MTEPNDRRDDDDRDDDDRPRFPRHNPLDPHNNPYPNDDTNQDDVGT